VRSACCEVWTKSRTRRNTATPSSASRNATPRIILGSKPHRLETRPYPPGLLGGKQRLVFVEDRICRLDLLKRPLLAEPIGFDGLFLRLSDEFRVVDDFLVGVMQLRKAGRIFCLQVRIGDQRPH